MSIEKHRKSLIERIENRVRSIGLRGEKMKDRVNRGLYDEGEADRIWLDQFAQEGEGLDVCCGDFLVGDAQGVDSTLKALAVDHVMRGENLPRVETNSLDFIVTNYFDCFPSTISVLYEWHRVLKEGGVLALTCRNGDNYTSKRGPLINKSRLNSFTKKTLSHYIHRTKFRIEYLEEHDKSLRIKAIK